MVKPDYFYLSKQKPNSLHLFCLSYDFIRQFLQKISSGELLISGNRVGINKNKYGNSFNLIFLRR